LLEQILLGIATTKFLDTLVPNNDFVSSPKDLLQQEKKLLEKKVSEQGDPSESTVGYCSSLPSSPCKQEYVHEK